MNKLLPILALLFFSCGTIDSSINFNVNYKQSDTFYFDIGTDPLQVAQSLELKMNQTGFRTTNFKDKATFIITNNYTYLWDVFHYMFRSFSIKIYDNRTGETVYNLRSGSSGFASADSIIKRVAKDIDRKFNFQTKGYLEQMAKIRKLEKKFNELEKRINDE